MSIPRWVVLMIVVGVGSATFPLRGQVCEIHPIQRIVPAGAGYGDEFGAAVAATKNTAVFGAPGAVDDQGAADLYRLDGLQWNHEQRLVPANISPAARFGAAVAIDGNVALIGAPLDDTNGVDAGSAHVYQFNGREWLIDATLFGSLQFGDDRLGSAVALTGNTAIVGAPKNLIKGTVYIFRHDGTAWHEQQILFPPIGSGNLQFGYSVAIDGERMIIGAPLYSPGGAAFVFRREGSFWVLEQSLLPLDPIASDNFGASVAIEGGLAVVGAVRRNAAYVFRFDGSQWQFEQRLDGVSALDFFGQSCALADGEILVGAPHAETILYSGYNTGMVVRYRRVNSSWMLHQHMVSNVYHEDGMFGTCLAVAGTQVLVGAPLDSVMHRLGLPSFTGAGYPLALSAPDCNNNSVLDDCDLPDCNGNRVPDECDLASGGSQDCNGNGVPDECEAPINYVLDDGSPLIIWGGNSTVDFLWLNQFTVLPGAEIITYLEIAWSYFTWAHIPVTVVLYRDGDNDGNPIDAILLRAVETESHNPTVGADLNIHRVAIPPTHVGFPGDKFFVGAMVLQPNAVQFSDCSSGTGSLRCGVRGRVM